VLQRAKRVLGEGLLTSEGEAHLRQRRLAQPAFHRQRIAAYAETMVAEASALADQWRPGTIVDMHAEMMRLTLVIAGKTLFGSDVARDAQEIGSALEDFMEMFGLIFLPFSEFLEHIPLPPMNRISKARKRLDAIIYRLIRERRASNQDHHDLLSMLIAATDVEGDRAGMNDEQLRDECVTIFLAGHETTANALTYAWMLLSQHPDVAARMHAEIATLGGQAPTADDFPRLRYTYAVIAETLRLYPPAWGLGRQATEPHQFGDVPVPAGHMVLCSQWVMHRDARFWPDPERFDPDRFTPEAEAARPRLAWMPFGAGPRVCIGAQFAMLEAQLLLAQIAQRFDFDPVGDTPPRPSFMTALRPAEPVLLRLRQVRDARPDRAGSQEPAAAASDA
jgi:cytochrome P450